MKIAHILKQNIAGKLLNHVIVFLINVVIVRNMDSAASGHFFNQLYLINLISFLFSAGMDYSAIAWISAEPNHAPAIHKKLTESVLMFTAISMLLTMVILPGSDIPMKQGAVSIILFSSGNLMLILFQGFLSAQKKFNLQNLILFFTNLIFLMYLLLVKKNHADTQNIALGYGCVYFIQGLVMIIVCYQKSNDNIPDIEWPAFYRHGFFIMISSLVYFCFLRTDNFFVEKYCDGTTLSNYVQCGKLGQYFIYFSSVISSTLLPFLASEKAISTFKEWKELVRPYFVLIITGAVLLMLFGGYIYPIVFGSAFNQMNGYMLILIPGYVCLGLLTLVNAAYLGNGNVMKIFKGDMIGLLIVLIADLLLVPVYGVYAAAMISSLSYVVVFLYLWMDVKKQFEK